MKQVVQVVGEGVAHLAFHAAAGVHRPVGEDGQMAVAGSCSPRRRIHPQGKLWGQTAPSRRGTVSTGGLSG